MNKLAIQCLAVSSLDQGPPWTPENWKYGAYRVLRNDVGLARGFMHILGMIQK